MKQEEKKMKNIKMIVAALLVVVMLMTSAALAAGKIKTDGQVNVRKGACLDYTAVNTLKAGKVLNFDKTKTDERGVIWYHVKGGWISSKNTTQIDGSVSKEKNASTKGGKATGNTVKATGDMNLRKGPGLDYAEVSIIKSGKTVQYLGKTKKDARGVAWYKVSYNNKTGWVSSKYGKLSK